MTRGIDFNQARFLQIRLTPVAVAQATTAEQTFTINGLKTTDVVFVNKPTVQAGLGIVGYRVSAANTLAITYCNVPSGGNITPTAETYNIMVIRPDAYETDGAAQLR